MGEGDYDGSEAVIRRLLAEAGKQLDQAAPVALDSPGTQAQADTADLRSPETYLGYELGENFASAGGVHADVAHVYAMPSWLELNRWGLEDTWTILRQSARLDLPGGGIAYRFHARDLHLVLGPGADGRPVRFRVWIDGRPPQSAHGADANEQGVGIIVGQRLYQLLRQSGPVGDRLFEIQFLDAGAEAFAFTFG